MRRDDRKLLERIAAGDDQAFSTFYRAHLNAVVAFFRRRVPDPELAFDLAAETFAVVAARADTFDGSGAADGLALRDRPQQAARVAAARARGGRGPRALGLAPVALDDADLERVEERAAAGGPQLERALASLPEPIRAALLARVVDERDYDEIAAELQCSEQLVRQRVHRGLARLRAGIGGGTMKDAFDDLERDLRAAVRARRRRRLPSVPMLAVLVALALGGGGALAATQLARDPHVEREAARLADAGGRTTRSARSGCEHPRRFARSVIDGPLLPSIARALPALARPPAHPAPIPRSVTGAVLRNSSRIVRVDGIRLRTYVVQGPDAISHVDPAACLAARRARVRELSARAPLGGARGGRARCRGLAVDGPGAPDVLRQCPSGARRGRLWRGPAPAPRRPAADRDLTRMAMCPVDALRGHRRSAHRSHPGAREDRSGGRRLLLVRPRARSRTVHEFDASGATIMRFRT